jgi:C-terminal processing protease CtpA/Prc
MRSIMRSPIVYQLVAALAAVVFNLSPLGCSSASSTWTGAVDAVFRYRPKENTTIVFEVRPASMSEEAGLKPGDVLLAVDGDDITNVSYEGVRAALRGPVGSKAVLTVKRGAEIIEITVERRFIKEDNKGAKTD